MSDTLHIYGQFAQHSSAYITGDIESLTRLRELIELAILNGYGRAPFFVNDGEGYDLCINVLSSKEMNKLSVPYTWEYAQDDRSYFPWNIKLNK